MPVEGKLRVYGSRISYYTGKLECYLRYRGIDYQLLPTEPHARAIRAGVGAVQMPVVELPDGRWMSDSTPILDWLERQEGEQEGEQERPQTASPILPADPSMRFVARLLEDYADEWLWRAAMHHRWSHRLDREHASALLADELLGHIPIPRAAKRWLLTRRQTRGFVRGDGVTAQTRAHVEQGVTRAYETLERIFERRRFILGDRPSLADFGFMGPMFRHLSMDPTPADRMRAEAPGAYAWVARMWNARDTRESDAQGALLDAIDEPIAALLVEACETHLVQLRENALAWAHGQRRYDQTIQGVRYESVPVSRYRVWCLEALRREWATLDATAQATLRELLREAETDAEAEAEVLWWSELPASSDYDPEGWAPFNRAINVFGRGVPQ
jgi:glutathione S-transferase